MAQQQQQGGGGVVPRPRQRPVGGQGGRSRSGLQGRSGRGRCPGCTRPPGVAPHTCCVSVCRWYDSACRCWASASRRNIISPLSRAAGERHVPRQHGGAWTRNPRGRWALGAAGEPQVSLGLLQFILPPARRPLTALAQQEALALLQRLDLQHGRPGRPVSSWQCSGSQVPRRLALLRGPSTQPGCAGSAGGCPGAARSPHISHGLPVFHVILGAVRLRVDHAHPPPLALAGRQDSGRGHILHMRGSNQGGPPQATRPSCLQLPARRTTRIARVSNGAGGPLGGARRAGAAGRTGGGGGGESRRADAHCTPCACATASAAPSAAHSRSAAAVSLLKRNPGTPGAATADQARREFSF